jgi:hypothetical protein
VEEKHPAHPHDHAHHHHHKPTFAPIHILLAGLIAIVLIVNTVQIMSIQSLLGLREPPKPALKLTLITADCKECFDMSSVFKDLGDAKEYASDSKTLPSTDPHSQKLMADYSITHLPAIVAEGDIDKVSLQGFKKSGNALVLEAPVPYYDVTSSSVKGLVSVQYITADPAICPDCSNITTLGAQLKAYGVSVASEKAYTPASADGKRLMDAYKIVTLPAAVLSSDLKEYDFIVEAWDNVGDRGPDGSYVVRNPQPPYYNITSGKVVGHVNIVSITDIACKTCYNVSIFNEIFPASFGVTFADKKSADKDSVEGKKLIAQYNITKVPTIILTGDMNVYPALLQVWPRIGSTEKDGAFVFRNIDSLAQLIPNVAYTDLTTGKTVTANAGQQ